MIERKWKPDNHKLEDAFFPVELCDLKFVYPAETDLFGKVVRTKDVLAKGTVRISLGSENMVEDVERTTTAFI